MPRERTFGYHPTEEPRIFEIDRDAGERLPEGWVDTPAKLAPTFERPAEADPPVSVRGTETVKTSDAARIDALAAELAALKDEVKTLRRPTAKRRRRRKAKKPARQQEAATDAARTQPMTEV